MSKQTTKRGQPSPSSGEVRRVDPWVPESLAPAGLFPVTPEVSRHVILMLPAPSWMSRAARRPWGRCSSPCSTAPDSWNPSSFLFSLIFLRIGVGVTGLQEIPNLLRSLKGHAE